MAGKTLYQMLESRKHNWLRELPELNSYFFDGAKSYLRSLPQEVVAWSTEGDCSAFPGRMHHRHNLIINLKEICRIGADGQQYILNDQQAILIFPAQCHHYLKSPDIERHVHFHFTFTLSDPTDQSLEPLRNKVFTLDQKMKHLFCEIIAILIREKKCHSPEIPLLLAHFLSEALLKSKDSSTYHFSTNTIFMKAMGYIRKNYMNPINNKMVADAVAISPSRLADIFKKQTNGVTIGIFIDRLRLFRAVDFLGTTDMNIAQIAAACGYGNQFSFSRRFKQLIGFSPNEYRKKCSERNLIGPGRLFR